MRAQRGLTIIELVVGLAIVAIAMAAGIPAFSQWIQNTQNRSAAESVLNGLQLARAEAVKRNTPVRFELTNLDGKVAWRVSCVATTVCDEIEEYTASEGNKSSRIGVSTAEIPVPPPAGHFGTAIEPGTEVEEGTGVTFDSLGRVPAANVGVDALRFDITTNAPENSKVTLGRRYVVTIAKGGLIRMCDPNLALSKSPQGCS